jgi:hypothetical protein
MAQQTSGRKPKNCSKNKSSPAIKGNDKLYNTATESFLEVKLSSRRSRRRIRERGYSSTYS